MSFNICKKYNKKDYYLYVYGNTFSYTFNDYDLDVRYPNHYSRFYKLSPEIFFLASFKNNPLKEYGRKIKYFVPNNKLEEFKI